MEIKTFCGFVLSFFIIIKKTTDDSLYTLTKTLSSKSKATYSLEFTNKMSDVILFTIM